MNTLKWSNAVMAFNLWQMWCFDHSGPLIQPSTLDCSSTLQDFVWAKTGRKEVVVTTVPDRERTEINKVYSFLKLCCLLIFDA